MTPEQANLLREYVRAEVDDAIASGNDDADGYTSYGRVEREWADQAFEEFVESLALPSPG